ncbi:hypothetical protein LRR18_18450, partial [Mangrovimonas sp. AS39]|uniref:hypothetical protein n=1 Tax=Mangrovimonas futianensis TaxID=2895523 RepID=UPI001E36E569
VEIPFTDEQEDMLYREACELADVNPRQLTLQYKLHPDKIWQGAKHVKYDYQGILTHALKRSKKWWLNALRGLVWGWTLAVNPANDKFWCSEFCA